MSKAQSQSRFKWMLIVVATTLLPLLLMLGFWQLERAEQKQQILQSWSQAQVQTQLPSFSQFDISPYIALELQGRFDPEYLLLDNRIRKGRAGYEVIALFYTRQSENILVNLGWIAAGNNRGNLPNVTLPQGIVTLRGKAKTVTKTFTLESSDAVESRVIQQLSIELLAARFSRQLLPIELKITETVLPELNIEWSPMLMQPEKHIAYAVQWFLMATALLFLLLWSSYQLRKEVVYE